MISERAVSKSMSMQKLLSIVLVAIVLKIKSVASAEFRGNKQCGLSVPSSVTTRPNAVLIAHRGASFHIPEHTLEAYRLALELGADYIEPDLVATKDGKLVAYHNVDLNATTNVEKEFPGRATFSQFANRTGYWVFNFDLAEVQKLRVNQRLPDARTSALDGLFGVPTLPEIIELLDHWNRAVVPQMESSKKRSGLYAELKEPQWYAAETKINLVDSFMQELSSSSNAHVMFNDTDCASLKFDEYLIPPLVVQCFDGDTLKAVSDQWSKSYGTPPPMVLLGDKEHCLEEDWWFQIGSEWGHFLHGVGPDKECFSELESAKSFMERAKEHELAVHVWTERPEVSNEMQEFDNMDQEMEYLLCSVGVSGMFTEDVARSAVAIRKPCANWIPTVSPSTAGGAPDAPDIPCPDSTGLNEETVYLAMAAGTMGILVGCVSTIFIMNSRICKSQRHTRRQLRIPTHEDVEII